MPARSRSIETIVAAMPTTPSGGTIPRRKRSLGDLSSRPVAMHLQNPPEFTGLVYQNFVDDGAPGALDDCGDHQTDGFAQKL